MCNEAFAVSQNGEMVVDPAWGADSGPRFCAGLLQKPHKGDIGHRGAPRPCEMGDINRDGPKSTGPAKLHRHLG